MAPPSSKKRTLEESEITTTEVTQRDTPPQKVTKAVYSIFTKSTTAEGEGSSSNFRWKSSLGPKHTCLHGMNLNPQSSQKVAAFDLDGTIIKSNLGKGTQRGPPGAAFQWWKAMVPTKLKEVISQGFALVIISNQNLKSQRLAEWKKKITFIAAALPDVPFRLFAATAKDGYRKPMPGMWYELQRMFEDDGVKIDKSASFFVGDAAGRAGDFASTDRKWAVNVGIPFFTPEEYFLGLQPTPYKLPGFHVSSLPILPAISPTSKLIVSESDRPEIVVFVGYPSLGKSTFYRRHFQPAGYKHINQDTLGSRPKCIKTVEKALEGGQSCVVDNTNRDRQTRKYYIDVAKRRGVAVRCFLFDGSIELAWHNNLYRTFNMSPLQSEKEPKRELVPYTAFASFRNSFEKPDIHEGISDIFTVNWVFEGDEDDRRRWSMWLQIDGK